MQRASEGGCFDQETSTNNWFSNLKSTRTWVLWLRLIFKIGFEALPAHFLCCRLKALRSSNHTFTVLSLTCFSSASFSTALRCYNVFLNSCTYLSSSVLTSLSSTAWKDDKNALEFLFCTWVSHCKHENDRSPANFTIRVRLQFDHSPVESHL